VFLHCKIYKYIWNFSALKTKKTNDKSGHILTEGDIQASIKGDEIPLANCCQGAHGSVVGRDTMLQVGRSWGRILMSLNF
jgi:hypothetical protein